MNNNNELLIYESNDGKIKLDINLENETVWLSLDQMVKLFGRDKSVISRHIKNIFVESELNENSTCSILEHMGNKYIQKKTTTLQLFLFLLLLYLCKFHILNILYVV